MINNIVLVGRLTKDVDLRVTSNGDSVGSFTLAIARTFTTQNGDRESDFINCIIWRKPAETLAQHSHKGSLIGITGRIQTRNYENSEGKRVYVTEVVAERFQFLERKKENEQTDNEPEVTNNDSFEKASLEDIAKNFNWDFDTDNPPF